MAWAPEPTVGGEVPLLKIGEVAERVALSLRTIRFYEEEGLVEPDGRTEGGFRLYSTTTVNRLELIKRMKPLGFTVEEMVEVLTALDALEDQGLDGQTLDVQARRALAAQLDSYREKVETKAADLLAKAARGREFGQHLRDVADQHR